MAPPAPLASISQAVPLHQILYVSQLAPGTDFSVVKEIVSLSRRNNPTLAITGALLFDGERFCQLLEGPAAAVLSLAERIRVDARHTGFVLLYGAPSTGSRLVSRWACGYCDPDALDALGGHTMQGGHEALAAFIRVLATADLSD